MLPVFFCFFCREPTVSVQNKKNSVSFSPPRVLKHEISATPLLLLLFLRTVFLLFCFVLLCFFFRAGEGGGGELLWIDSITVLIPAKVGPRRLFAKVNFVVVFLLC